MHFDLVGRGRGREKWKSQIFLPIVSRGKQYTNSKNEFIQDSVHLEVLAGMLIQG